MKSLKGPVNLRTFHIDAMKIKEIRRASGLSQSKFARADFGQRGYAAQLNRKAFTDRAGQALLRAGIANDPRNVIQALRY